jgi:hypothetical protein
MQNSTQSAYPGWLLNPSAPLSPASVGLPILVLLLTWNIISRLLGKFLQLDAPLVGVRWRFEPGIVSRHRFFRHGKDILDEGYRTVFRSSSY